MESVQRKPNNDDISAHVVDSFVNQSLTEDIAAALQGPVTARESVVSSELGIPRVVEKPTLFKRSSTVTPCIRLKKPTP